MSTQPVHRDSSRRQRRRRRRIPEETTDTTGEGEGDYRPTPSVGEGSGGSWYSVALNTLNRSAGNEPDAEATSASSVSVQVNDITEGIEEEAGREGTTTSLAPTPEDIDTAVRSLQIPTFSPDRDSPYFDALTRKACAQSRASSVLTTARQIAELRFNTIRKAAFDELTRALKKKEDVLEAAKARLQKDYEDASQGYQDALQIAEEAYEAEVMTQKILQDSSRYQYNVVSKLHEQLKDAKEGTGGRDVEMLKSMEAKDRIKILSCPITHEVFEDPVLAPSGITYERAAVTRWIRTHYTDPLARSPLSVHQLTPNLAIKNFIQRFPQLVKEEEDGKEKEETMTAIVENITWMEREETEGGGASPSEALETNTNPTSLSVDLSGYLPRRGEVDFVDSEF